jgi:hypothetical protein
MDQVNDVWIHGSVGKLNPYRITVQW